MLFDRAGGQEANATTLATLAARNQRAFFYVADWADFTGSSSKAYDACVHLDNRLGSGIDGAPGQNEEAALKSELAEFAGARATKASHKAENRFYLRSMATSSPTQQIEYAALLHYLGGLGTRNQCPLNLQHHNLIATLKKRHGSNHRSRGFSTAVPSNHNSATERIWHVISNNQNRSSALK